MPPPSHVQHPNDKTVTEKEKEKNICRKKMFLFGLLHCSVLWLGGATPYGYSSQSTHCFVAMKNQLKFQSGYSLTWACNFNQQIIWNIWPFYGDLDVSCGQFGRIVKRMEWMQLFSLLFLVTIHFQESNCCKKYISRTYKSKRLRLNGRSGRKNNFELSGLCQTDCPGQDVPTYRWFLCLCPILRKLAIRKDVCVENLAIQNFSLFLTLPF